MDLDWFWLFTIGTGYKTTRLRAWYCGFNKERSRERNAPSSDCTSIVFEIASQAVQRVEGQKASFPWQQAKMRIGYCFVLGDAELSGRAVPREA
jgi:hypothetical protein